MNSMGGIMKPEVAAEGIAYLLAKHLCAEEEVHHATGIFEKMMKQRRKRWRKNSWVLMKHPENLDMQLWLSLQSIVKLILLRSKPKPKEIPSLCLKQSSI